MERRAHYVVAKSAEIDDGWTLSPEVERLLTTTTATNHRVIAAAGKKPNAKIDLNSASVDELCLLPGIGRSRAKQIIAWRAANGPFATPAALLAISGIGARTLEALSSRLA